MTADSALVAAITGADAAIYAYGVIGARTAGPWPQRARRAMTAHRAARERWQARAAEPVASPAAFDLPAPVTDRASAQALAVLVEGRLAAVYADLAARVTGADRAEAVTDAMACASRAIAWGGATEAFPHG